MKEIKQYDPCSLEVIKREFPMNTICNDLREIFYTSDDEKVRLLARVAITKAKAMTRKLYEYNNKIDEELWEYIK